MAQGITWTPHLRMTLGGTMGTNTVSEEWSNTIRWKTIGAEPTFETITAACQGLVAPCQAWMARATSMISGAALARFVKLNWIGADGKQRDVNTVVADFIAPGGGSHVTDVPPFYQTFAVTLRTRLNRGRTHAGRVYPPLVIHTAAEASSPYTSGDAANGQADSYIQFLRAARAAIGVAFQVQALSPPDPAVFSPGNADKGTQPMWSPIISAVVDRVPDVQHRRTRQIPRSEGATVLLDPA